MESLRRTATQAGENLLQLHGEQKQAEETKAKQEQRSQAIEKLLSEANKQADKPGEAAPAEETIPAK